MTARVVTWDGRAENCHLVTRDVCVARTVGTDAGALCGGWVHQEIEGIPLCITHSNRLMGWHSELIAAENRLIQAEDEREERARKRLMRSWRATGPQVVYYMRRQDGLIKIGTSTNFYSRSSNLRTEHGPLEILLTHCGDYKREGEMHDRFAALWVTGEWFRPGPELLAWIIEKRRKHENVRTRVPRTMPLGYILELAESLAAAPAA